MNPTRIVRRYYTRKKSQCRGGKFVKFVCDNGITYSGDELSKYLGISHTGVLYRIRQYGLRSEKVLKRNKPLNECEPTYIVERKLVKNCKPGARVVRYLCDNGVWYSLHELLGIINITKRGLDHRIRQFGLSSTKVLHVGRSKKYDKEFNDYDNSTCRRNHINCKHYSDCQASRLGMVGAKKWIAPEVPGSCYEAPEPEKAKLKSIDHSRLAVFGSRGTYQSSGGVM